MTDAHAVAAQQRSRIALFFERLLEELENPLFLGARIFDLGSGGGDIVRALRSKGYNAFGADFYNLDGSNSHDELLQQNEFLLPIKSLQPYELPYEDDSFDFALSQNVFEHVMDYEGTLRELARIVKPGSYSLHLFPSKYTPIEPHVHIPGATLFQSYPYLFFWSWFSKRNPKFRKTGKPKDSWSELATNNAAFLQDHVNYLDGSEILRHAQKHFTSAKFIDATLFKLWPGRLSQLHPLARALPFLLPIHSACRMRVLLLRK